MIDVLIKHAKEILDSKNIHFLEKENNYRYERKFTVPDNFSLKTIEQSIKHNKGLFREAFHLRKVNNIYFDTAAYNDYFDNILGVSDRKKIRIRWYGETFGRIKSPILEIKIKKGLIGDKWSFKLKSFMLDNNLNNDDTLQQVFIDSNLPLPILESVKMRTPTLLNSYSRKYFVSANKKFRVTLDFTLLYYKIEKQFNNFNLQAASDENKIVELKYNLIDDREANSIATQFPFRLNKNSKYVNGINTLKEYPQ